MTTTIAMSALNQKLHALLPTTPSIPSPPSPRASPAIPASGSAASSAPVASWVAIVSHVAGEVCLVCRLANASVIQTDNAWRIQIRSSPDRVVQSVSIVDRPCACVGFYEFSLDRPNYNQRWYTERRQWIGATHVSCTRRELDVIPGLRRESRFFLLCKSPVSTGIHRALFLSWTNHIQCSNIHPHIGIRNVFF